MSSKSVLPKKGCGAGGEGMGGCEGRKRGKEEKRWNEREKGGEGKEGKKRRGGKRETKKGEFEMGLKIKIK